MSNAASFPVACQRFGVALSWDPSPGKAVDLDLQAIAFDTSGKVLDAVYYNNLKALKRGMTHSSDENTGEKSGYDEMIWVDFQRLPPEVCLITFVVSAYSGGYLSDASNGFLHLLENSQSVELAKFHLESSAKQVDLVGALVRSEGWAYQQIEVDAEEGKHFIDILEPIIGNFVRQTIPGAPKRIKACFAMDKGTVVDLPRSEEIRNVKVGLGWDTGKGDVDLDVSAVLLSASNQHVDTVFFGNLKSTGVSHSGDNLTGEGDGDDEVISFDLLAISPSVQQVFMVVNIYTNGKSFSQVANPYSRILNDQGEELCKYMLADAGNQNGLIISRLFREPGDLRWGFQAIGVPCQGQTWKDSMGAISHFAGVKATQFQMTHATSSLGSPPPAAVQAAAVAAAPPPPPPASKSSACAVQ